MVLSLSTSINARVIILALCMSSNVDWYLYEDSFNGFQVIERTPFCDRVQGK